MKKKLLAVMLLFMLISGSVFANRLINPGFEIGPIGQVSVVGLPNWEFWGSNTWHHSDSFRTFDEKAIAIFWTDSGVGQFFDATAEQEYILSVQVLSSLSTDTYNGQPANMYGKNMILSIEWYDSVDLQIGGTVELDTFEGGVDPDNEWTSVGDTATSPVGTVKGMLIIGQELSSGPDGGGVHLDNASVTIPGEAYSPNPAIGSTVDPTLSLLSWTNAATTESSTVEIVEIGGDNDPNTYVSGPIDAVAGNSVVVSLQEAADYAWRVTSEGSLGTLVGPWWTFDTQNVAPVIDPIADQYIWIDNPGAPAGLAQTELDASYTDDGLSGPLVTDLWTVTNVEGANAMTFVDPDNIKPCTVTFDGPGLWTIEFTADDGLDSSTDSFMVYVYDTACDAAIGDPDDNYNTQYPDGNPDFDGNCITNLADIAVGIRAFLECMSTKPGACL